MDRKLVSFPTLTGTRSRSRESARIVPITALAPRTHGIRSLLGSNRPPTAGPAVPEAFAPDMLELLAEIEQAAARTRAVQGNQRRHRLIHAAGVALGVVMAACMFLGTAHPAQGRVVRVGAGGDFATLEGAINGKTYGAGDTIAVLPGTYDVASMLQPLGSGVAGSPIVVRGTGSSPSIISGSLLSNSKALWDLEHANSWWVFENLVVRDMRGAQTNARGFFLVGCSDVVIQNSEVTNCWNGFMSSGGAARVTIQFCNVHDNGGIVGPAHDFYLSGGSDFVVRHNWIHDAHYGTCFKDRTRNLQLLYNRIENADLGGYEVSLAGSGANDLGQALLVGNVIVKSPTSANQTHLVRFEDSRLGTLVMINNTILARSNNIVLYSIASTTSLQNNIFSGGKTLFASDTASRVLTGTNNWAASNVSIPAGLTGTLTGTAPSFVDATAGDLHLADTSPCIDTGDNSASPLPEWQYLASASREARSVVGAGIDIGAFERGGAAPDSSSGSGSGSGGGGGGGTSNPPAAPEVTIVTGTLVSGSGADLQANDGAAVEIASMAPITAKPGVADWSVTAHGITGTGRLRVTVDASATAAAHQYLWLWQWSKSRWQQIDHTILGAADQTRTRVVSNSAPYISPGGQVRLRFQQKGKKAGDFHTRTDFASFEVVAARTGTTSAGVIPEENADPTSGGTAGLDFEVLGSAGGGGLVRFAVSGEARLGITLYDVLGRRITHLEPAATEGARHLYTWDGRDVRGMRVSRGIYFARAELRDGERSRRVVWIRD